MLTTAFLFLCVTVVSVSAQDATFANAPYCTGLDVDGTADDWEGCNATELTLTMRQIGAPSGNAVLRDSLRIQFAHDDTHIYVLARVDAPYYFNLTTMDNHLAHSTAVMWKVGAQATMFDMGGCPIPLPPSNDPYNCPEVETMCENNPSCECAGRIVDIWHFESSSPGSLPGVQYPWRGPIVFEPAAGDGYTSLGYDPTGDGRYQPSVERLYNGNDHTSNSDDELSVHPCLRGDDGGFRPTPNRQYRNQLRYAWSHSAIDSYRHPFGPIGADGTYIYEFSRPLVTNEDADAQFTVGQNASFAFAFWIPSSSSVGWTNPDHYVAPMNFQFGTVMLAESPTVTTVVEQSNAASMLTTVSPTVFSTLLLLFILLSY